MRLVRKFPFAGSLQNDDYFAMSNFVLNFFYNIYI